MADGTTSDKIDAKVGARKAQRILERLQLGTRTFRGRGTCLRLEPGATFTLVGHPRTSMNMDHLVLDVVHRGWMSDAEEPFYENEFVTAPKSVPYRPQVAPEAPVIGGIQWALATVPPGGEYPCGQLRPRQVPLSLGLLRHHGRQELDLDARRATSARRLDDTAAKQLRSDG